MLSFLPIWEALGSRYTGCIPRSAAATSKLQRVRVLVFSKIRAIFLPSNSRWGIPAFFSAFSLAARASSSAISAGVKSSRVKKLLPFNDMGASPSC